MTDDGFVEWQVPEEASNLNSGDSFVLLTPTDVYLWVGNGCSAEESTAAEEISQVRISSGNGLMTRED